MFTNEERWAIFVDYSAVVHDLLDNAQKQMAEATLIDPISPEVVDQLSKLWAHIQYSFNQFTLASEAISKIPQLLPEQVVMAEAIIRKINEAARDTDESLRLFFQKTGLASTLPSREETGEGLKPH